MFYIKLGCLLYVGPQFMHTFTFSATRKFLTLVAVMFLFSAFSTINAYAQDVSVEIARQQEMIEKLEDQLNVVNYTEKQAKVGGISHA